MIQQRNEFPAGKTFKPGINLHNNSVDYGEKHLAVGRHGLFFSLPSFPWCFGDIQRKIPIICQFCSLFLNTIFRFADFCDTVGNIKLLTLNDIIQNIRKTEDF